MLDDDYAFLSCLIYAPRLIFAIQFAAVYLLRFTLVAAA